MLRWDQKTILSEDIHIFRGLPRKVRSILTNISSPHQTEPRALISLIRTRGNCVCPRCLIPKSQLQNLGLKADASRRVSLARVDDARHRSNITSARSIIYDKGYAVNGAAVDAILKEESWTANSVSRIGVVSSCTQHSIRTRFQSASHTSNSTCMLHLLWTSCMNSS